MDKGQRIIERFDLSAPEAPPTFEEEENRGLNEYNAIVIQPESISSTYHQVYLWRTQQWGV
jgi:hypothetical protein